MKKILFPIAVASALSIAALGTLQGLAQEDATRAVGEVEKKAAETKEPEKKEPAKATDEKVTEDAKQPAEGNGGPIHEYLEKLSVQEAEAIAKKSFSADVVERIMKLVSKGKELRKYFVDRVKKANADAEIPGISDEQVNRLAGLIPLYHTQVSTLDQGSHQFFQRFSQPDAAKLSTLEKLQFVGLLDSWVKKAEDLRVELEKNDPLVGNDAKPAGEATATTVAIPRATSAFVERLSLEAATEYAKKRYPEEAAQRVIALVSRGKELRKLLEEKVKEEDAKATKPGLDEQQISSLAENVNTLRSEISGLDQAYSRFFNQERLSGPSNLSTANRLALIPSLTRATESAEIKLGLRAAPVADSPSSGGPGGSFGGGPRRTGGQGFNFPNPPTVVNLLNESMKDEEVKTYLQERFPAAAMERVGKLVTQARELTKSLDEKFSKIDAELGDNKLSDEQIELMAGVASTYRGEKERLKAAFLKLTSANVSMQTMSEAFSWLPQLSSAVKRAESSMDSLDRETLFAKAGVRVSDLDELYERAKGFLNASKARLNDIEQTVKNPKQLPERRKVLQEQAKELRGTIVVLGTAIDNYADMLKATEPVAVERMVAVLKTMQDVMATQRVTGPLTGKTSTPADPKEAHAKLYQRAKSVIEQVDNKLKEIGVQLADPGIASDELDRIANQSNDLQFAVHGIRQAVAGYENSIQNQPSPNQSMVVGNVVEMQHAIRKGEDVLGIKVTVSVASDTPYADAVRKIEQAAGDGVRIVIGSDLSPVAQRLIAACDSVKSQLEARLKETDEKLNAPEAALEQIEGLANFKSRIETAINRCESVRESLRSNKLRTAGQFAQVASQLQDYTAKIVRPQLGPSGPVYTPTGMMQGMVQGMMASPTGSMGGSPMGPGMPMVGPPGMSGMPGLPGAAPASQFQELSELRVRYRKHLDEKNATAAAEVKDKITKELARIFDAQQAAREKQLDAAKDRLKKLEEQQAKRKAARDELIESRTKQIIHELEGTQWTDEVPVEEGEQQPSGN